VVNDGAPEAGAAEVAAVLLAAAARGDKRVENSISGRKRSPIQEQRTTIRPSTPEPRRLYERRRAARAEW
jgi:hypothetical protein